MHKVGPYILYNTNKIININTNNTNKMEHLMKHGWVTIPIYDEESLEVKRREFVKALINMPEFKNGREMYQQNKPFVLGAFAALGNPSSFHNHMVRNTRIDCHKKAKTLVFNDYLKVNEDTYVEQTIDRLLYRTKGVTVGGESKHRDESKYAQADDLIFGGWVNFDEFPHTLKGCPGSHMDKEAIGSTKGFNKIPKDSGHKIESITVPPGHLLIFFERMVHEVANVKAKKKMHRVFIGFRLTKSKEALHERGTIGLCNDLIKMNTMQIKSGQTSWMWTSNHWCFPKNRQKIKDISCDMDPKVLEDITVKTTGEKMKVVPRFMKSLKEYDMMIYDKYDAKEVAMHIPHRAIKWPSKVGDKKRKR